MRKIALVMAMAMALTSVNTGAFSAISPTYTVSAAQKNTLFGKTIKDNNVEYQLKDGVLTVSGTGIADNSYRTKYKVDKIKKVVIKSGITGIADDTFSKLKNLKKITIPNTVKQLGLSSMSGLNLDKITLPNSVEEIGRDCMRGGKCNSVTMPGNFKVRFNVNDPGGEEEEDPCREMYEILPKTNHVYLTSAFNPILKSYYCEAKKVHTWKKDSKYKTYGDNIYTKNGKTLVFVPAGTKHLKVRKGCKKVLLDSFCYNYEPEDWYEYFCTKLKTIEFPSSLKQIEGSVDDSEPFYSCTLKFQKKKLPGTILETLLEHHKVEFFSKKYGVKTVKGMKVSYDNVLLKGPSNKKSVIVPKGVKRIFKYAFLKDFNASCSNTKLKKITLPSSMKEINSKAFAYTRKLESVKIPNSVTVIGSSAFSGCNLKTIKLPKKLKKIGNGAFSSTKITNVTIPKSVTEIGDYCFSSTKITNVTIPKSVTKIGDYCFSSTKKLNKLVMNCKMNTIPASIASGSSVKEVVLPQNITKINQSAFDGCKKLESITLPEKLITIGDNAFSNCKKLKTIILPKELIEIKWGSFYGCESLSDVKFNSKLKKIGALAFKFTGLKEIKIPDSVEECGFQCFCSSSLEKIQFSKKMTSLPGQMCCHTNIKSVIIPGNIKKIGNGVFEGCPLERVELQEGVEIVDLQSIVGKSNNENIEGRIKVTYDMVEVLVPESLKKMHIIDNSEYYKEEVTVSCSKDSAFTDEKVVEIPKNSSTIDISQLRSDADVYCKFEKICAPDSFSSYQYIVPFHFVFK